MLETDTFCRRTISGWWWEWWKVTLDGVATEDLALKETLN